MSSVLLIEIRVPDYRGEPATLIVAEWVKQRGNVLHVTGKPDRVYSSPEACIRDACIYAKRAALAAMGAPND